jgi:hypothetical protein
MRRANGPGILRLTEEFAARTKHEDLVSPAAGTARIEVCLLTATAWAPDLGTQPLPAARAFRHWIARYASQGIPGLSGGRDADQANRSRQNQQVLHLHLLREKPLARHG